MSEQEIEESASSTTHDIGVGYNSETKMFVMQWRCENENGEKTVFFESTFFQESFENLTAAMVRAIKDVNLEQAKKYTALKEAQDLIRKELNENG